MAEKASYDEKLGRILVESAAVFAEKGYHNASIRDIAAATEVSLSGLYYYFKSKEELLFLIQHHCFDTILQRVQEGVGGEGDPERRLRILIRTHLGFFVNNMKEMKVLSHEADGLTGQYRRKVTEQKRRYAEIVQEILHELQPPGAEVDVRTATFSLFGMMNWIYTWYRPGGAVTVDELAEDMAHVFLAGFLSGGTPEAVPGAEEQEEDTSIWRSI